MALIQLPTGILRQGTCEATQQIVDEDADQAPEIHRQSVIRVDSGIEIDAVIAEDAGTFRQKAWASGKSRNPSTFSLPVNLERQGQCPDHSSLKRERKLSAGQRKTSATERPIIRDLVIQAITILHEADSSGSSLNLTDCSSCSSD